jgi:hypothetical protein
MVAHGDDGGTFTADLRLIKVSHRGIALVSLIDLDP